MGATSSAQRVNICEEDAVDDEQNTGLNEVQDDIAVGKLLQKHGQDWGLEEKNENQLEELNDHCENRVIKNEDGTETEELQDYAPETNVANLGQEIAHADDETMNDENETDVKLNDTEVGFKKIFRFVGFKFTVKKDNCDTTTSEETVKNEQDANVSKDTTEESPVCIRETDVEKMQNEPSKGEISPKCQNNNLSSETNSEMPVGQILETTDYNEQIIHGKELVKEIPSSMDREEPMSPIKQFFTQGIWASLRKRRKEEEASKGGLNKEEEIKITRKEEGENFNRAAQEDSTCVCLDVFNIALEEGKDLKADERYEGMPAAAGAPTNSHEQEKVHNSPFRRVFRPFSIRRQKETKSVEQNLMKCSEYLNDSHHSFTELIKVQKEEEEPKVLQPKPVEVERVPDVRSEDSKKKLDSTVSWETLICGGSSKKRFRKTSNSEDETQDKGEEPRKTTESPLESSTEGDYDHLPSSNEHTASPAEGEGGSTWKSLKKLLTPKKVRAESSGLPEQIPSDSEFTKDESSCSIKKLIPRRKKRKSNGWQEHSSSDEAGKGTVTDSEDDETPVVVPLSEYEITEPESLKEFTECIIDKEMQPMTEEDKSKGTKLPVIPSYAAGPSLIPIPPNYIEDLTDFISKHQQLSDIPEEGITEESVQTPVSSAEWTTQDDTLAEDIAELTADAVTAPEHITGQFNEDETTEMVSAVSHLTESPETSRNITPATSKHDITDPDVLFQEVVESICRTQSVLSFQTTDRNPEVLAVSVFPCVVESTVSGKTNILVAYETTETTSCVEPVSQKVESVEEFISLSSVESISETNEAVATELTCEDLPEDFEGEGIATNEVCEAKVSEVEEFHEALLVDKTPFYELEKVPIIMHAGLLQESQKDGISNVVQVKEKNKEYTTEILNCSQELMSVVVKCAVQGEFQLIRKQVITKNINMLESEGQLDTVVEDAVCEQQAQYVEIFVEGKKHPDFELTAINAKQVAQDGVSETVMQNTLVCNSVSASQMLANVVHVTIAEVVESIAHDIIAPGQDITINEITEEIIIASVCGKVEETTEEVTVENKIEPIPDKESGEIIRDYFHSNKAMDLTEVLDESSCRENDLSVKKASLLKTVIGDNNRAAEESEVMSEVSLDLERCHINTEITHLTDIKTKQCTGHEVHIKSFIRDGKEVVSMKKPVASEQPSLQIDLAEKGRQSLANTRALSQPKSINDSELSAESHTKVVAPESVEEESQMTQEVKRECVDAEVKIPHRHLENVAETRVKPAKPKTDCGVTTELHETAETVTPSPNFLGVTQSPKIGIDQLEKETESESQSSPQFHKEDKQVLEHTVKVTETISEMFFLYTGETNGPKVCSPTDNECNEIEDTWKLEKHTSAKPGGESEISEEPVATLHSFDEKLHSGRAMDPSVEAASKNISAKNTEGRLVAKQETEALFTPESTKLCEPVITDAGTTEVSEVVSKHNLQIIAGSEKYAYSPDVTEHVVLTEMQVVKTAETLTMMEINKELTTINSEAEAAEEVMGPMVIKNKFKTLPVTQPQVEMQVMSQPNVQKLQVTESNDKTPEETGIKVEVVTDVQIETPVLTLLPKLLDTISPSEICSHTF